MCKTHVILQYDAVFDLHDTNQSSKMGGKRRGAT